MNFKKAIFLLSLSPSLLFAEESKVPVGFLCSLSGDLSSFGEKARRGFEIALEDYPEVKAHFEDASSEAGIKLVTATKQLLDQDSVKLIIGPGMVNQGQAIADIMAKKNVVSFTNSLCSTDFSKLSHVMCGYPSTQIQLESLKSIDNVAPFSRLAFISDESPFREEVLSVLKGFEKQGIFEIVYNEAISPGQGTDYKTNVTKMLSKKPDAVFATSCTAIQSLQIFKLLKDYKFSGLKIGFLDVDQSIIDQFSGTLEGILLPGFLTSKYSSDFTNKYQTKYNETPDMYGALGYDLAKVALGALKANNWKSEGIIEQALTYQYDNPAIPGFSYDDHKMLALPTVVLTVRDGKLVEM